MRKPGYSLSRRMIWINVCLCWTVIAAIVARGLMGEEQAVHLASIVVPSLVALIAAVLGIHRFAGAMDLRSVAVMNSEEADADPGAPDEADDEAAPKPPHRGNKGDA